MNGLVANTEKKKKIKKEKNEDKKQAQRNIVQVGVRGQCDRVQSLREKNSRRKKES